MVHLQERIEQAKKTGDAMGVVIAMAGGAGSEKLLTEKIQLPVLQDSKETDVLGLFGATKDATYVIDATGHVRAYWQLLLLDEDGQALVDAIEAARE